MSDLRWTLPAESPPADTFRVYRNAQLSQTDILASPDAEGIYSTALDPWPAAAEYTMTAVNSYGESPPSNVVTLPEPEYLLLLLFSLVVLWMLSWIRR